MSRPPVMETSVMVSFQLFLTVFNALLMIFNGSIFNPDYSSPFIEDIKALKGEKKKEIQAFIFSPKQKDLFKQKETFNSSSPIP